MLYAPGNFPFTAEVGHHTTVGSSHEYNGIPNQDAANSGLIGPYAFIAVADGVGETSVSNATTDTASQLAIRGFSKHITELGQQQPQGDNYGRHPETAGRWAMV